MNSPYETTGLNLTPDDVAEWRRYERANRRAAKQYRAMPTAFRHAVTHLWERP